MVVMMNTGGVAMTNCVLVADETAAQAVIFDAPDHTTEPLLRKAKEKGWEVVGLWLTHGHFDHFADHASVTGAFPSAQVVIHAADAAKLEHPEIQTAMFDLPFWIPPVKAQLHVIDGQKLNIGSLEVEALHTPGHAPGHVAYYFPQEKLLIGGDLIIGGSVGRTDLPEASHPQLEESIRKVMALPDDTRLIGGHGPATTLGRERQTNYFVRAALGLE